MGKFSLKPLVFFLLVISQYGFGIVNLVFSSLLILIMLLARKTEPVPLSMEFKLVSAILFLGVFSGIITLFFNLENNVFYYLRDCYYFIQPVLIIFLGNLLIANTSLRLIDLLRMIVLATTFYSLINLLKVPFYIGSISELTIDTRYDFDFSNRYAVIGLAVLYFYGSRLLLQKGTMIFCFLVLIASLVLSFSRTEYLIALFMLIVPFITRLNLHRIALVSFFSIVVLALFTGSRISLDNNITFNGKFIEKFMLSIPELVISDVDDVEAANTYWRGYEAFLGLKEYLDGNLLQLLFGKGFSTVVDVPSWVFSDDFMTNMPFFHNGYITILLKAGLVGLCLFIYLIFVIYRHKFAFESSEANLRIFLAFAIAISTLVIHGIYYKHAPFIILFIVGILIKPQKINMTS